jgi:hypothetical protein
VVCLTVHLVGGETARVGSYLVNDDGTLDAWDEPGETMDSWLGRWAVGAWESVRGRMSTGATRRRVRASERIRMDADQHRKPRMSRAFRW